MANVKSFLRLLPCLLLTACGSPTPDGQLPVPSGEAAPTKAASVAPARKTDDRVNAPAAPAQATTTASKPSIPVNASSLPPVMSIPGIACTKQHEDWVPECVAGDYEVSVNMDGCSADGFYGLVHGDDKSAILQSSFPPFPTAPLAKVREAQFVCIAADARKRIGERLWVYVMAIPPESIPACKGREICGDRGVPPVTWIGTAPKGQCHLEHGKFIDCAAGWVSASEVEEFSNGL